MKETEIFALERSISDQKSKMISSFSAGDDNVIHATLIERSKKLSASARPKDDDKLKEQYEQILSSQAKKRLLDEDADMEAYLLLTKRYLFYLQSCIVDPQYTFYHVKC
jgi:hypothetical protein